MDYATLSLAEVSRGLRDVAADALRAFGALDASQLNWRPDDRAWSVAQCLEHLLTANRLMLHASEQALQNPGASLWQRVPLLPGLLGRALIRSQSPANTRRHKAAPKAQPAMSGIPQDVVGRFADQQREISAWVDRLDESRARLTIMTSPFIGVVTYSVLDGCRLIVAHDRRHFEQAKRVLQSPGHPGAERAG